jgi:hypothetical protein
MKARPGSPIKKTAFIGLCYGNSPDIHKDKKERELSHEFAGNING